MRAEKNIRDSAAMGCHCGFQPAMHILQHFRQYPLAVDDGLVGNHNECAAFPGKDSQGFQAVWKKDELLPALDVIRRVLIDDPVPVQKNDFLQQHRLHFRRAMVHDPKKSPDHRF